MNQARWGRPSLSDLWSESTTKKVGSDLMSGREAVLLSEQEVRSQVHDYPPTRAYAKQSGWVRASQERRPHRDRSE